MSRIENGSKTPEFVLRHEERDRSQIPLWAELERELELAVAMLDESAGEGGTAAPLAPATIDVAGEVVADESALPGAPAQLQSSDDSETPAIVASVADNDGTGEGSGVRFEEAALDPDRELGMRLQAARDRAGIARDEVARRTRIAPALIAAMEEGRFPRLGARIFAIGYLRSFARAVELPEAVVATWEARTGGGPDPAPVPSLAGGASRRPSRQVASPILYTLLTALIAVPAYYGVKQAQQSPLMSGDRESVVDVQPTAGMDDATPSSLAPDASAGDATRPTVAVTAPAEAWKQPLMASMTPMLGESTTTIPPVAPEPPLAAGMRRVELELTGQSWIEITADADRVIERGLLAAGSRHRYDVPPDAHFRIGDVGAVTLRADGKAIDLVPLARANVASFELEQVLP